MDLVDHTASQFTIAELVIVAETVGLAPTSRWSQRRLIDAINAKITKDGIPEPPDIIDDANIPRNVILVEEYLYVAGFVDGQGNIIEHRKDKLSLEDFMALQNISKKPDCYSIADDKDPACQRCLLYKYCIESRLANLMPCYGIAYDATCADCRVCINAPFCKEVVLSKSKEKI